MVGARLQRQRAGAEGSISPRLCPLLRWALHAIMHARQMQLVMNNVSSDSCTTLHPLRPYGLIRTPKVTAQTPATTRSRCRQATGTARAPARMCMSSRLPRPSPGTPGEGVHTLGCLHSASTTCTSCCMQLCPPGLASALAVKRASSSWICRFGGRDGKMARIKAQEAAVAAAALGAGPAGSTRDADSAGPGKGSATGAEGRAKPKQVDSEQQSRAKRRKTAAVAEPSAADGTTELRQGRKKKAKRRVVEQEAAAGMCVAVAEAGARTGTEPGQAAELRAVHEVHVPAGAAPPSSAPTATSGWWGAKRFTSAGCLEGLEHTAQHVARERTEFTEGTQEGLYTAAQAAKTANKKGLGATSTLRKPGTCRSGPGTGRLRLLGGATALPEHAVRRTCTSAAGWLVRAWGSPVGRFIVCWPAGKVAGARWQGTRTLIWEEDAAAPGSAATATAQTAGVPQQGGIKWKKLARQILLEVLLSCCVHSLQGLGQTHGLCCIRLRPPDVCACMQAPSNSLRTEELRLKLRKRAQVPGTKAARKAVLHSAMSKVRFRLGTCPVTGAQQLLTLHYMVSTLTDSMLCSQIIGSSHFTVTDGVVCLHERAADA